MNFLAHELISLALCELAAFLLGLGLLNPVVFAVALLGGVAPDLDHSGSKIFKWVATAFLLVSAWLLFDYFSRTKLVLNVNDVTLNGLSASIVAAVLLSVFVLFVLFLVKPRHRGITHSFAFALLFAVLVGFLSNSINFGVIGAIAYSSHLLADGVFKLL